MTDSNDDTRPPRGGDRPFQKSRGDARPQSGGDKPYRARPAQSRPDAAERPAWRPEGQRAGDRPFHDKAAGPRPRAAYAGGERSSQAPSRAPARASSRAPGGDDRPRRPKPAAEKPFQADDSDHASARDEPAARPDPEARLKVEEPAEDRIAKVIARAGIASRRDAEALIAEGRVTLNGEVLASPAINVTAADRITVDGEPLPAKERTRLWLYHKPRGLVTTARDPEGRATVFEQLPEDLPRVVAIGRLDINTEGLLLLTNDGGLAKVIAHPDTGWLRRYKVRAHGEITQADLDALRGGVTVDEMDYGPVEAVLDRVQGDNVWLTLGLREGKNREVKRILEHLGLGVNRLIRLSFGPFQLGELESGLVEEVRTRVLKDQLGDALAAEAEVDFESPVRQPIAPFGKPAIQDGRPLRSQAREEAPRRDAKPFRPQAGAGKRPFQAPDRDGRSAGKPAAERKGRDPLAAKRSVWRAGEDAMQPRPPRKAADRDADPRATRAANAERPRERAPAVAGPSGGKVRVERLVRSPQSEPERPRRSAPPASAGEAPRGRFAEGGPPRRDTDRPPPGKRPFRASSGELRGDGPPRSRSGAGERPFRPRSDGPPGDKAGPRRGPPRGDAPGRAAPGRGGFKAGPKPGFKGGGDRGGPGGGSRGGPKSGGPGGPRGKRP